MRQTPRVMNPPFMDGIERAGRSNAADVYMGDDYMDALTDGRWEKIFKVKSPVFTTREKGARLDTIADMAPGSDTFFPFDGSIDRANKSGVKYAAQSGGSVRDDQIIGTCNQHGMVMALMGIRLFHH